MKQTKTTFDVVEIREYPVVLSDNPACDYGPSVELGWEYITRTVDNYDENSKDGNKFKVSVFEKERQGKRRTTASKPSKLYLSQVRREKVLREANYSEQDLKNAVRAKSKARRQRSTSNLFLNPVTKIQSAIKAGRRNKKLKRAVRNLNKKKEDPSLFNDHSEIYKGWWLPFSGDLF